MDTTAPTETTTEAAPTPAAAPATPAARRIFDPPASEAKPEAAADAPAAGEEAPSEEAAAEPEAQAERPEAAPKPTQNEERIGAARASIAKERSELARQAAQLQEQMKELEGVRSLKSRLDKFKEDPLLLLQEFGHKFEDVSKRALNAPPTDPRTLELKADLEAQKAELAKIRTEVEHREAHKAIADQLGKIGASLETDDYEQARAAGWTPERVWGEMEQVFRATGKLPAAKDVLNLIEETELERLPKIVATAKAKAKLAPPKPPAPTPKKAEPAKTITSSRSAPPAKTDKPRTTEQKMQDFLAEHGSIFTKES
jgi:hypothetical protein